MREWYAPSELAGLPGLPKSRRAVQIMAKREAWKSRSRKGKGGGNEYHIASLPKETRYFLLRQAPATAAATEAAQAATEAVIRLSVLRDEIDRIIGDLNQLIGG